MHWPLVYVDTSALREVNMHRSRVVNDRIIDKNDFLFNPGTSAGDICMSQWNRERNLKQNSHFELNIRDYM